MEQRTSYQPESVSELTAAVRDRRLQLGWTQLELAEKIGMSRKWVSDMERGKPTIEIYPLLRAIGTVGLRIELQLKESKNVQNPTRIRRRKAGGLVRGKPRPNNV
ncbi:helix-turn-helix domain-containing protein [Corynebacterium pseudogenitalium]|uniref:Helix-turn-helix transcriptional regulator n=1 Tax=Corynebacterium pseudogenitalium TaxID=38303 RepID=A0ABD4TUU8_9CORY|nr:helix-turn-helix domain-containing protein [Corynebacterium pseudogenitalium]MCQ4615110.1 helix-turn-helix transcriptional regulator [Corynebacterium pseudogenitalium]